MFPQIKILQIGSSLNHSEMTKNRSKHNYAALSLELNKCSKRRKVIKHKTSQLM